MYCPQCCDHGILPYLESEFPFLYHSNFFCHWIRNLSFLRNSFGWTTPCHSRQSVPERPDHHKKMLNQSILLNTRAICCSQCHTKWCFFHSFLLYNFCCPCGWKCSTHIAASGPCTNGTDPSIPIHDHKVNIHLIVIPSKIDIECDRLKPKCFYGSFQSSMIYSHAKMAVQQCDNSKIRLYVKAEPKVKTLFYRSVNEVLLKPATIGNQIFVSYMLRYYFYSRY